MNQVVDWSKENKFQLNPKKCKEHQCLELVKAAKILCMLMTDDLKWNSHIENTVSKASKRLHLLRQLKRANAEELHCYNFILHVLDPSYGNTTVKSFTQACQTIY